MLPYLGQCPPYYRNHSKFLPLLSADKTDVNCHIVQFQLKTAANWKGKNTVVSKRYTAGDNYLGGNDDKILKIIIN